MTLQIIWFCLWGLLWAVFFITDGFDLGIGTLYPFLGKDNDDKRMMIKSIGPLWDGNEVWLITAGGVTFAAFPLVYAVMFSSLYSALMLILFALIIRGVSFEFRGKIDHPTWRSVWDKCIFIGSVVPAFLFGVAFANIFKGIPIDGDGIFHGNLLTLLNPYGIMGGALFLLFFLVHGALWLSIRTTGDLFNRAVSTANSAWILLVGMVILFLLASFYMTPLFNNYAKYPGLSVIILLTVIGLIGIKYYLVKEAFFKAWFSSALAIIGATFFGIAGLYPNLLPSSLSDAYSLTAHNASSSPLTLKIMLTVVIIFLPIVIGYQIWVYYMFKDRITKDDLAYEEGY